MLFNMTSLRQTGSGMISACVGRGMQKSDFLSMIAEHLGVSTDTIHRWIRAKKIPAHRVGLLRKFMVSEVDQWVRAGKVAGKDTP